MHAVSGPSAAPLADIASIAQLVGALATIVLAGITYWYARSTKTMAKAAAEQAAATNKSAQGDVLLRLNELYADRRTAAAIRFVHAFNEAEASKELPATGKSRYSLGQAYYTQHATGSKGDLCRWHLTNFWYTVAILVEQGVIDDELIQRRFGSSLDVIDILERIEAVRSYGLWEKQSPSTRKPWEPTPWPVWNLFARSHPGAPQGDAIPVYVDDFERWRNGEA